MGWSMVIALEPRGRPKKTAGVMWTCHPSVVLKILGNDETYAVKSGYRFTHPLPGYYAYIGNAIKDDLRKERKKRVSQWKNNLPKDWDEDYYWFDENYIVKLTKANQKTVGCDLYHRRATDDKWVFRQKWKIQGNYVVSKLFNRGGKSMKFNGDPTDEDPNGNRQQYPLKKRTSAPYASNK